MTELAKLTLSVQNSTHINASEITNYKALIEDFMKHSHHTALIIKCHSIEEELQKLCHRLVFIKAAGGIVIDNQENVLIIKRLGCWDFPKGKIEGNETPKIAALREVEEECGINTLSIIQKLSESYHIYALNNKLILKKTYWFKMKHYGEDPKLTPQKEEDITLARWVSRSDIDTLLENSYASLRYLWHICAKYFE